MASHNTALLCLAKHPEKNVDIFSKEVTALLEYGGKYFKLTLFCANLLVVIKAGMWRLTKEIVC